MQMEGCLNRWRGAFVNSGTQRRFILFLDFKKLIECCKEAETEWIS